MAPLGLLLRCLLVVTFCFESSLAQWASTSMALDNAHQVAATEQTRAAAIHQGCGDDGSHEEGDAVHPDCDCGAGCMCACACAFLAVAIAQSLPFAPAHVLAITPLVSSRAPASLFATTGIFRPPIG